MIIVEVVIVLIILGNTCFCCFLGFFGFLVVFFFYHINAVLEPTTFRTEKPKSTVGNDIFLLEQLCCLSSSTEIIKSRPAKICHLSLCEP